MDGAEFIDKILTPLAGGVGVFLVFRLSSQLKKQPMWAAFVGAALVTSVLATLKWIA